MNTTIRLTGPLAALEALPTLLGFVPAESVVIIGLIDSKVVVTARFDYDDLALGHAFDPYVEGMVERAGITQAVTVLVADDAAIVTSRPWESSLRRSGVHLLDSLWVDANVAGSYLCQVEGCCPRPFTFDTVGLTTATLVAPSRDALAADVAYVGPLAVELDAFRLTDMVAAVQADLDQALVSDRSAAMVIAALRRDGTGEACLDRRDVAMVLLASIPDLPTWALARVAQHTDDACVLAALSALAYIRGDGAAAWMLIDRSRDAGGASLADLIASSIDRALPPTVFRDVFESSVPKILERSPHLV